MKRLWQVREFSTLMILVLEVAFFTWYLWPDNGGHPFLNVGNALRTVTAFESTHMERQHLLGPLYKRSLSPLV